jgi:hypothetical protein
MAGVSCRKEFKFKNLAADSAAWRNSGKFRPNSGIDSADQEFTGEIGGQPVEFAAAVLDVNVSGVRRSEDAGRLPVA